MKNAIIYVRVSSKQQATDDKFSLETQEAQCRDYAKANGYEVASVYREIHTATELRQRKQLMAIVDRMSARDFHAIIVHAVDRLSRDPNQLGWFMVEADSYKIPVEFVTEKIDDSLEGQLVQMVRGISARIENEKRVERSMRGKKARVQSGKIHGFGPELYGYWRNKETGKREIIETEAMIVRRMFSWVADEGLSVRGVVTRLNADQVPSPSAGKMAYPDGREAHWGKTQVHRMLKDSAYKGEAYVWKKARNKRHLTVRKPEEWIALSPDTTPAIVEASVWSQVQERLANNAGASTRNVMRPYLLRGFIFCSVCGRRMRSEPEKGKRVYRCSSRETFDGKCGGSRVPASHVEAWAWMELAKVIKKPSVIQEELERRSASSDDTRATVAAEQGRITGAIKKLDGEIERLKARYARAKDDAVMDMIEENMARLNEERQELQAEASRWDMRLAAEDSSRDQFEAFSELCGAYADAVDEFEFDDKRTALEAFGVRIEANSAHPWAWKMKGSVPTASAVGILSRSCS